MDTPARTALGGGIISVVAAGGMVAAAVLAASTVTVLADPTAPAASAAGLTGFEDCEELRTWYVDHTIDEVGPYGWGQRRWPLLMRDQAAAGADGAAESAAGPQGGVANGATGTNTQEAGVDEPDVAKTDGRIVVRLDAQRRLVVTDVSGDTPRHLASWPLPRDSYADELLLVGDHALLVGGGFHAFAATDDIMPGPIDGPGGTEVLDVDLSDPRNPRLDGRSTWSGHLLSLRQYDDLVRLVSSTGLPALPFVQPRAGVRTPAEATRQNRQVVARSRVEDWVPGLTADGTSRPLVECTEVYHPETWSGTDTVSVATFRAGEVGAATAVAVTGAGSEVYSSVDRLYVTEGAWSGPVLLDVPEPNSGPGTEPAPLPGRPRPVMAPRTHVHAFALEGDSTRYVASGTVDGRIRDRWSLDERDGRLRVAVSWPGRLSGTGDRPGESGVLVLEEEDGMLVEVGRLTGLGPDEEIQSVRWLDDLAVVVTFRQVDPLYTVDLRDPTRPRLLGELKIRGFSAYLHPIGGDRLLGLGTDATARGRVLGAQAAVFDLRDLSRVEVLDKVTFGPDTWLEASHDPRAFTWLPEHGVAVTSLHRPSAVVEDGFDSAPGAGQVLLHVAGTGALTTRQLPSVGGWQQRALPLDDGRVALVGDRVRLIDVRR